MDCISDARQTCGSYQFLGSRAPEIQPDGLYFGRAANLWVLPISGKPRARNTARWIVFRTRGKLVGPTNFWEAARQKYSQMDCISDAWQTCGPYQFPGSRAPEIQPDGLYFR